MAKLVKQPAVDNDQDKSEFFHKVKDAAEALLSISIPTKGMTLDDRRKDLDILLGKDERLRDK